MIKLLVSLLPECGSRNKLFFPADSHEVHGGGGQVEIKWFLLVWNQSLETQSDFQLTFWCPRHHFAFASRCSPRQTHTYTCLRGRKLETEVWLDFVEDILLGRWSTHHISRHSNKQPPPSVRDPGHSRCHSPHRERVHTGVKIMGRTLWTGPHMLLEVHFESFSVSVCSQDLMTGDQMKRHVYLEYSYGFLWVWTQQNIYQRSSFKAFSCYILYF